MVVSMQYTSERDFVANYLLPELKGTARKIGVSDVVEFHVEKPVNGIADLTAEKGGKGLFVVEAKFKKKTRRIERDLEPRDPDVVNQAVNYAVRGGYPHYATCNTKRIVLFQLRPGYKPFESEIASFEYDRQPEWAAELLNMVMGVVPLRLKPIDDALVDTIHEAFRDLYPRFLKSFDKKLVEQKFRSKYMEWLENQGIEFTDENNRLIVEQTTYLQLTKLLFYGVVQSIYHDKLKPIKIDEGDGVQETLNAYYNEVLKIDYSPIYEADVISEIPFTPAAEERFRTLIDTLNEFDFSQMESDFLGRVYENLIPSDERKRLGQFYTPQSIVDFITSLTIDNPDALVLDPGCGSGSFLVKSYHKLRELNKIPKMKGPLSETFHQQLLDKLYGVDINQFPAHLSVINLSIQNARARIDKVNVIVKDFFDVKPGQATLTGFQSFTTGGEETKIKFPPYFDIVVANPPYIRQELLGKKEKKKIKALIEDEFKGKVFLGTPSKKVKKAIILDKQSDIYIYFFIHGLALLRNKGHLGFISSNKWLEVGYGKAFQKFLLSNSKIEFIVEFDKAVFPDLEVDTTVTILQKEKDIEIRDENFVKFVQVKRFIPIEELTSIISNKKENFEDDYLSLRVVKQGELKAGKWNLYLRAPPVFFSIIENKKVKPLIEVVDDIRFGTKTGYDNYFILTKDDLDDWKIEKKFLMPCAPAGKNIGGLILRSDDVGDYFLWVHKPKTKLKGTNVLKYIKYGEKLEVEPKARRKDRPKLPNVKSIKGRKLWYSIPQLPLPVVFFPMWFRYKYRAFLNEAKSHGHSYWNYIITRPEDAECVAALLNSTMTQFLLELFGRQYSGMLHMKVYELKQLPILDSAKLTKKQKEDLSILFRVLSNAIENRIEIEEKWSGPKIKDKNQQSLFESQMRKEVDGANKIEEKARQKMDDFIYDVLGLGKRDRKHISKALIELRELRKMRTRGISS
ncbi:MAG: class I SAM-dependent DNA methyltransferase [Candidatus Hydrothermarchaeales archaeon]